MGHSRVKPEAILHIMRRERLLEAKLAAPPHAHAALSWIEVPVSKYKGAFPQHLNTNHTREVKFSTVIPLNSSSRNK
jgi:hypothetical protein